jgi:hypothetical protein
MLGQSPHARLHELDLTCVCGRVRACVRECRRQETSGWDMSRLLTTRADLQAFLSAPLPSHWQLSDNWFEETLSPLTDCACPSSHHEALMLVHRIPDLTGLDEDEGWQSAPNPRECCEAIRQLAARFEFQPDRVSYPLYTLQLLGTTRPPSRPLHIRAAIGETL